MNDGAIAKILTFLEYRGYATERQLYEMGEVEGFKISTLQRRLREMCQPDHENFDLRVGVDRAEDGTIKGYTWDRHLPIPIKEIKPIMNTAKAKIGCCPSFTFFQIHARDCEKIKEKTLF